MLFDVQVYSSFRLTIFVSAFSVIQEIDYLIILIVNSTYFIININILQKRCLEMSVLEGKFELFSCACMHSFFRRLIVYFTYCLISFISYSSQIFIIWPWYGREVSIELLTLLVPFKYVTHPIP